MARDITRAVEAAEAGSQLEIAVRVVRASDRYRDAGLLWALALTFVALQVVLFSPLFVWPIWVTPVLGGVFIGGLWWSARSPLPLRWFTRTARRRERVLVAARAAFYDESVATTADRTGVLVYCSVAEDVIEVIPDQLLELRVPSGDWARVRSLAERSDHDLADRLMAVIDALARLGRRTAATAGHDSNEIPDAPNIG